MNVWIHRRIHIGNGTLRDVLSQTQSVPNTLVFQGRMALQASDVLSADVDVDVDVAQSKLYSRDELTKHVTRQNLWIALHDRGN